MKTIEEAAKQVIALLFNENEYQIKVEPYQLDHSSLAQNLALTTNQDNSLVVIVPNGNSKINQGKKQFEDFRNLIQAYYNFQKIYFVDNFVIDLLKQLDQPYRPLLTWLFGGIKPIIYVFDDYNNYVNLPKGQTENIKYACSSYLDKEGISDLLKTHYKESQTQNQEISFKEILSGFCNNLNDLSKVFEIKALPLWIPKEKPDYKIVNEILPWGEIEENASKIAAFIVDLEWLPTLDFYKENDNHFSHKIMGYRGIDLLRQRYPEIPCFILTGLSDTQQAHHIQNALRYGASWGFSKGESHHFKTETDDNFLTQLDCLTLAESLEKASLIRYHSYSEVPFTEILDIDPKQASSKQLIKKLNLEIPIGSGAKSQALLKMIAGLIPDAIKVKPVKVLTSGKSGAQATFFIEVTASVGKLATRFVKIATWFTIQKEFFAYQKVISSRLNSYTAKIIQKPVVTEGNIQQLPLGGLLYSLAGFPEDYQHLLSFADLIEQQLNKANGGTYLSHQIEETLTHVLLPLYQSGSALKPQKRPIWHWLWDVLPPLSGVLIPLSAQDDKDINNNTIPKLESYRQQNYTQQKAWSLASFELTKLLTDIRKENKNNNISPFDEEFKDNEIVRLSGWYFWDIQAQESEGSITLIHPDLNLRINLRGTSQDIRSRFGATWIRPKFPVDVLVCLDPKNQEIEKITKQLIKAAIDLSLSEQTEQIITDFQQKNQLNQIDLINPFEVFADGSRIPYHYTIQAHEAPIHGDLNIQNILYSSEQETVGWLIDFERVQEKGMVAFDFAKLEVEICNHHLFPYLSKLSALLPNQKSDLVYKLLYAFLTALDFGENCANFFCNQIKPEIAPQEEIDALLLPLTNGLQILETIRNFAKKQCKLEISELKWALAGYFLNSVKFNDLISWSKVLAFLSSTWHLNAVIPPMIKDFSDSREQIFKQIQAGNHSPELNRKIDSLLLHIQQEKMSNINQFTQAIAQSEIADEIAKLWKKYPYIKKKWDLASTGGIANITPIFGYLWLMVAADKEKDENNKDKYTKVVPKISSDGSGGGTIDTLASGGLTFTSNPHTIIQQCRESGGIICEQNQDLTPIDKALMSRRRDINLMTNVSLTYSSILGKKIAMGCTHAIIDVKLGKDTKILAPWMKDDQIKAMLLDKDNPEDKLVIEDEETLNHFIEILKDLGISPLNNGLDIHRDDQNQIQWIVQRVVQKSGQNLGTVKEVHWLLTNSDISQCRAIGRQLVLLHLDEILSDSNTTKVVSFVFKLLQFIQNDELQLLLLIDLIEYKDKEIFKDTLLNDKNNQYYHLYREVLPKICAVENPEGKWDQVQQQWQKLKQKMPKISKFRAKYWLERQDEFKPLEISYPLKKIDSNYDPKKPDLEDDLDYDLKVITFALNPYKLELLDNQEYTIKTMDTSYLSDLFTWLCGDNKFDEEVGIWLHKLPGETVEKDAPVISIFYRPSICDEKEVKNRVRYYLTKYVK